MNIEPCMFCGGKAHYQIDTLDPTYCWIGCFDCLAEGPLKKSEEDAVTAWNAVARIVREHRESNDRA